MNRSRNRARRVARIAVMLAVAGLPAVTARGEWMQDFAGVPDGTLLQSLPGWSAVGGSCDVVGGRIRAGGSDAYVKRLDASQAASAGNISFSFTWRDTDTADDEYHSTELQLGSSDGVHAFIIQIKGGTVYDSQPGSWDNTRDNSINLSTGGVDVASAAFQSYGNIGSDYNSRWLLNVTYTVEINNIDLKTGTGTVEVYTSQTWTGSSATGRHPIAGGVIKATGGGFDMIDTFRFARGGNWREGTVYLDDLRLTGRVPVTRTVITVH